MYQCRKTFYIRSMNIYLSHAGAHFPTFFTLEKCSLPLQAATKKPQIHANNASTDTTTMQEKLGGCLLFLLFPEQEEWYKISTQ